MLETLQNEIVQVGGEAVWQAGGRRRRSRRATGGRRTRRRRMAGGRRRRSRRY